MKKITVFLFLFFVLFTSAQNAKPEYTIIIDGTISTEADVEYYAKQGRIKSMDKGVSDAQYKVLIEKYGEDIGDKMFIMLITLHPEESYKETRTSQFDPTGVSTNLEHFNYKVGAAPERFTIELMDGTTLTSDDLKGKVVLINFWATWCAPCIMEFYDMPKLILEPFENADFIFLPISIGESKARVTSMMKKLNSDGINFSSGLDPKKELFKQFVNEASIPKSLIIDKNGLIQLMTEGNPPGNLDSIHDKIKALLEL